MSASAVRTPAGGRAARRASDERSGDELMAAPTTTPDQLAEHFRDQLGERVLDTQVAYDQLTVTVDPQAFPQVARFCKADLEFSFFDFLSAVDERDEGFSVIVRLYSHVKRQAVILRTAAPGGREAPTVPTLTNVYAGANWHERETYDMFGIVFEGHPGLLPRILTVENFEGWPLRKEFRLASRDVKPWPGAKEPGGSDDEDGSTKPAAVAVPAPGADPGDRAAAAKAKAERAKAKAAEARARKAAERAAAMEASDDAPDAAPDAVPKAEVEADPEDRPLSDEAPSGDVTTAATAAGGDPDQQGTPGVEAEGTHDLDADDSTARDGGDGEQQEDDDDE